MDMTYVGLFTRIGRVVEFSLSESLESSLLLDSSELLEPEELVASSSCACDSSSESVTFSVLLSAFCLAAATTFVSFFDGIVMYSVSCEGKKCWCC